MAQLNDLNDDCLLEVLDRLPPKELFKIQRVNRRVNQLAAEKIRVKIRTITLNKKLNSVFSECVHLNGISRNRVLFLDQVFKRRLNLSAEFEPFRDPSKRALFLSLLTKCCGVKNVDFDECELSEGLLLEVVRRCPALEYIKLCPSGVTKYDWERVLDQIENKIVHFAKRWLNEEPTNQVRFLELVASKCTRIKQIWVERGILTDDFKAAIKMLPKSCWVKLYCNDVSENTFEDVVDELNIYTLDWSALCKRFDRLSSLKFAFVEGPVHSVDFAGLKKLDCSECFMYYTKEVDYLMACRFPRLQEFCFNANRRLTENDFNALFNRMSSVKKLVISCDESFHWDSFAQLPGSSIFQLKNLEIIELIICDMNWQPKDILNQLQVYVNGIVSLKKLVVKASCCLPDSFKEEVKQMKLKQSFVKIDLQNLIF